MPPRPIALSDDQLAVIEQLAEPLQPADRSAYLRRVAELLDGLVVGDGSVARAAKLAQGEFRHAPALDERPRNPSKWSRRAG